MDKETENQDELEQEQVHDHKIMQSYTIRLCVVCVFQKQSNFYSMVFIDYRIGITIYKVQSKELESCEFILSQNLDSILYKCI